MYRKNRIKATVALAIVIAFIMPATAFANTVEKQLVTGNNDVLNSYSDIINITVEETWIFASDTSNGIQIPVDVRRDNEWKEGFIDTPTPENPRHYCLDFFYDNDTLEQFLSLYSGKAVILYCRGAYRSYIAAKILVENDFTGTIYNMIGGTNAWNAAELPVFSGGYLNITVHETWELLSDTANCIQLPIDVRRDDEWKNQHIDTPEAPIHYCLDLLKDEAGLQEFLSTYNLREVILYCKGAYRSFVAAKILLDANFTGTIYNMIGGMNAWNEEGLPTKADQPPTVEIINPREGYLHLSGIPIFPTILNVLADTVSIGGFRLQPIIINATDDYDDKEDLMVKVYLNDIERNVTYNDDCELYEWKWTGFAIGTFNLTVTATDAYDGNSSIEMEIWNFCILP